MNKSAFTAFVSIALLVTMARARAADGEVLINQAKVNAGGIAPGDTAGFPATLNRPGRYKLSGNLTVPANNIALEVVANDVVIDLNGFTIAGEAAGGYIGVLAAANIGRMRISNGTITGVTLYGISGFGARNVVEDMRVVANGTAMALGNEPHVRNSTVANNTSNGIRCFRCLVEGSIVSGNGGVGVYDSKGGGGLLRGNVIVGNASYGIISPDPPYPKTGYGNNLLSGNNGGGLQGLAITQLHPNSCDPACP